MNQQKKMKLLEYSLILILLLSFILPSIHNVKASTSLPNSIIGEDYLLYYNNHDPSVWTPQQMAYFTLWECNTARLGFYFNDSGTWSLGHHSIYVESKMETVLEIFDSYGVKIIMDLHNLADHYDYVGTSNMTDNWKELATKWKDDPRVEGFNIFNEPNPSSWGPSITTKEQLISYFADLIDEIRTIDPNRKIFFPVCDGMSIGLDDPTTTYNLMVTYGIWAKGNIVMDITHPYFFENAWDMGLTPEQKAAWYSTNRIDPWIALVGAENCWIGETFAWVGKTYDLQVRWLGAIIDESVDRNLGLQVWSFFGKKTWCTAGLVESKYLDAIDIFIDGFESGDFSEWTATGGSPTINETIVHEGSYSSHIYGNSEYVYKNFGTTYNTGYFRIYVYIDSRSGTERDIMKLYGSGGVSSGILQAGVDEAGSEKWKMYYRDDGEWQYVISDETYSEDIWYCVEVELSVNDTVGTSKMWVDGVVVLSVTGLNNTDRGDCAGVLIGGSSSYTPDMYIDDVFGSDVYIGTDNIEPTYSNISASTTIAGSLCQFNVTIDDNVALESNGQYQFVTNNTGSWVWDDAINFTSTPQTVSTSKTLNSTVSMIVGYFWEVTDNIGNLNSTAISIIVLTEGWLMGVPNYQITSIGSVSKSEIGSVGGVPYG